MPLISLLHLPLSSPCNHRRSTPTGIQIGSNVLWHFFTKQFLVAMLPKSKRKNRWVHRNSRYFTIALLPRLSFLVITSQTTPMFALKHLLVVLHSYFKKRRKDDYVFRDTNVCVKVVLQLSLVFFLFCYFFQTGSYLFYRILSQEQNWESSTWCRKWDSSGFWLVPQ